MDISVVLAAHNEADSIGAVLLQLREVVGDAELIVVDDGSLDGTAALAEQGGARVIRCTPNRGKGAAMRVGIAASRGEWLIFLDADGQDDPADIPILLAEIREDVGLINGSRFLGTLLPGSIHPLNRLANQGLTALLSLLFGHRITDSQAGFRVIRGDLARAMALRSDEYEFETEVLAKVLCSDLRVVEVPVTRHPRSGGHTDFRRVHNGLRILRTMLLERARHSSLGGN